MHPSGVAQHADGTLHPRQVASRDDSGRLVVDSNIETSRTPVHESDGPKNIKKSSYLDFRSFDAILEESSYQQMSDDDDGYFNYLSWNLMVSIAELTSLGTTSPLYSMQQAMYFPCRGSNFTIWLAGAKHM
jgi:hypothetical protein